MSSFVLVCADEATKNEGVELPMEKNGTLLLSVVQSQFEGASGLKYRNPTTGGWRAVKLVDGVLHPPENGWGGSTYIVVIAVVKPDPTSGEGEEQSQAVIYPSSSPPAVGYSSDSYKRKLEDGEGQRASKNPRSSSPDYLPFSASGKPRSGEDLIVLGLEWSITDSELKEYFEKYGEVTLAEVKKEDSGKSRGFGFVRFADKEVQTRVYDMKHSIKGRRVELKYPKQSPSYLPSKLFVGCLPLKPEVTTDELREHFSQFGQLSDVYIPRPYRGFGFVSFTDPKVIQRVIGMQHTLRKSTLNITFADPKGGASHKTHHYPYQSQYHQTVYDPYNNYYANQYYGTAGVGGHTQASHYAYATPHNTSAYGYGSYAQPQPGGNYSRPPPNPGPPPPPAQTERQGYQQQYPNHPPSPGQRSAQYGESPQNTAPHFNQPPPPTHQQSANQLQSYRPHSEGYTISNESVGYHRGGQQYHGPPAEPGRNQQQQLYDPKQIWQNY